MMELSPGKKMTETLHHALCAMMQFLVIFLGDTSSPNKKIHWYSFREPHHFKKYTIKNIEFLMIMKCLCKISR
jgi:hypothetical protein